jgi:hypothetical protein
MRKLTLDLSSLAVQSFATDEAAARLFGTVQGRQKSSTVTQEPGCSAADTCPSVRESSDLNECRPTPGASCATQVPPRSWAIYCRPSYTPAEC